MEPELKVTTTIEIQCFILPNNLTTHHSQANLCNLVNKEKFLFELNHTPSGKKIVT